MISDLHPFANVAFNIRAQVNEINAVQENGAYVIGFRLLPEGGQPLLRHRVKGPALRGRTKALYGLGAYFNSAIYGLVESSGG